MYRLQLEALQSGATVVTANKRLARTLRSAYNTQQIEQGRAAWLAPDVLSWNAWLRRLWENARLAGADGGRVLLSDAAAGCLWQHIVQSDSQFAGNSGSGSAGSLARGARRAWALVNDWQALTGDEWTQPDLSPDQRAWLRWSGAYRDRCRDAGWIDTERLPEFLAAQAPNGCFDEAASLLFCGFDEWSPARLALIEALKAAGADVVMSNTPAARALPDPRPCATVEDEWRQAAGWARNQLDADPDSAVGIVIPELTAVAGEVRRTFLNALSPAWRVTGIPAGLPLNVSYGQPLAELPAITAALRLLRLATGRAQFDDFSLMVRSSWLAGAATEADARAQLDIRLRDALRVEFNLTAALPFCHSGVPELRRVIAELDAFAGNRRLAAAEWAHEYSALLQSLGWPGADSLDSASWQTVNAFNEQLAEFAEAAGVFGRMSHAQATSVIASMAAQTVFQPQGSGHTGVQVMGVLEAAGHEFDHLWVCGMARELWPGNSRPDAFIPLALQRRLAMPDSAATRSLEYATLQVERLAASAPSLCVSWPAQQDGEALGPTPLFGRLASTPATADSIARTPDWNERMQAAGSTELLAHDPPPVWPDGHKVAGGASVLTRQAVSPLNAFIENRLGAFEIRRASVGINAMQRGNLTHRALEEFYAATPTRAEAFSLTAAERGERLRTSLQAGLNDIPGIREPFMQRLAAAELAQQLERIAAFLEIDKERDPFTVVEHETAHVVTVGALKLRLKLDRMDVLGDGQRIVIDYKTGQVNRQSWNPDNPRDLQLPLYVTCIAPDAAAVAFAQISSRGIGYDGVGNGDIAIPGLRSPGRRNVVEVKFQYPYTEDVIESWDELRKAWIGLLERLANEFAAGDFRYDPRNPDSARGQFAVLSRVYDSGPVYDGEAE